MAVRRWTGSEQLAFDLAGAPSHDPDDYLVTATNAAAEAMVSGWPAWPGRCALLIGPPGSGKSHLGSIWASRSDATTMDRTMRLDVGSYAGMAGGGSGAIFIDDADVAGHDEAALFHLYNRVQEESGWMLLTATKPPTLWGLETADLVSRLRLCATVTIGAPDDLLMKAVLVKLFADRQLRVDEDVVAFAARHCERSLSAVAHFVATIDAMSLTAGRRVTRRLAASVLTAT